MPVEDDPRIGLVPDGRACKCCKLKDTSPDPLDGGYLFWFYAPQGGLNCGFYCWYCGKVWFAWYRHHYGTRTLTLLALSLGGESSENIDEFDRLRTVLVNIVLEAGHRNVRPAKAISAAATVTVTSTSRQMVSVEEDDDHVELEYYKTEYKGGLGDPLLNGLGHRVCNIDGQLGVIVTGPPIKNSEACEAADR